MNEFTKTKNTESENEFTKTKNTESETDQPYEFRYAGIKERKGIIPLWLILVTVSLLIWSVYYTIRYWSPD